MAEDFYGYETTRFLFEGKEAVVVFADPGNRTDKWILKTEYFGAFPETELLLLKAGYNLAHVNNDTRWVSPQDIPRQAAFCRYLHKTLNFREKCALVGMSCGGMQAIYLASMYPELVAAVYLDAPVVNLLSCPGDLGAGRGGHFPEFQKARGMTMAQLIGYRDHPLDHLSRLKQAGLPIILVSGDADTIVPFEENGRHLCNAGIPLELHMKPGGDHHPHGLPDNQIIADFIREHY